MIKKFISYYKPHKKLFIADMVASFFVAAIGLLYPILTNKMLKTYIPDNNIKYIVIFGIALFFVYIVSMFLNYFVQYYGHVVGVRMQGDMRRELFGHFESLPYKYFDDHETGKLMSRITSDLQDVSELAHHGPENFFIAGITLIGSFTYLCFINWQLTLIIFAFMPLLIIISVKLRKKMSAAFLATRKDIAKINGSINSSLSGIRVTKAFTNDEREVEKFDESNQAYVKSRSSAYKRMGQFSSSTSFLTNLFNVVILLVGGVFVAKGKIDLADYTTFVVAIALFLKPLRQIIGFMEQFENGATGFRRFLSIMEIEGETDKETAVALTETQGNITFNHVNFKYNDEQDILKDVSFDIKSGEVVALVGPSGGGKTTICHLLPKFYSVDDGMISVDGKDINDLELVSLRENIGIVQQSVFLFSGTVKENILYGKLDATDEEVILAAQRANIHEYIVSLPHGYETNIGERGVRLSGGQQQRLSIARVFLKNPQILILDEATSALDNTTEILIQGALDELCKGRTTIVVAHRLSTVKNATKIIVIGGGEIIEQGTHNELIELDGEYNTLYKLQFRKSDSNLI